MQQDKTLRYYWDVISRRLWLLVGTFAGVAAVVFVGGARQRPLYRSSATLLVSQDGTSVDPMHLFGSAPGLARRPVLVNHIEILKSYAIARMVADGLPGSTGEQLRRADRGDAALYLQRAIAVRPVRDADIINFSVVAADPALARELAAAYVDAYRAFNLNRSRADVSAVREFVGAQLELVGARLDSAEARLEQFKSTYRIASIEQETRATVDRQTQVVTLYEKNRAERAGIDEELAWLRRRLDSLGGAPTLENLAAPMVTGLRSELARLEVERTGLLVQGYDPSSPRVNSLSRQETLLKRRLEEELSRFVIAGGADDAAGRVGALLNRIAELEPERERLRAAEGALAGVVTAYDGELRSLPGQERSLARLTREVEVGRQVHMLLAQRHEETRIQEAGRLSAVGVIDRPRPGARVRPNHKNNALLALLLAGLLCFGTVLTVDYLDTTVRRPEDLERQGLSVLATVPRILDPSTPRSLAPSIPRPLALSHPGAPPVEAFRVLRTNLQFAGSGRPLKTIVVTSPGAGEGKSTVASNLASVMAQSGRRVLLVDADLRRPRQHSVFGRRKKPGLTDTVMLGASFDDARLRVPVHVHTTDEGAVHQTSGLLDVLFAGTMPPSPVDFLNSPILHDYLQRLTGEYDCVVIDTPPILVSADAAVLAARADGVVLVARMAKTDWRALDEARKLLAQAGAHTLGVAANDFKLSRGYGYARYRYRYYHYRSAAEGRPMAVSG